MGWFIIRKFVSVLSLGLLIILIFIICIPFNSNSQSVGSVIGKVYDSIGNGVPNANVTILQGGKLLYIPENPQLSNDGRTENVGQYGFPNIPVGQYTIIAEKEGHQTSQIITISPDRMLIQDLVIPNYIFHPPYTPTPAPTPAPTPTITALPSPTPNNDQFNNGLISGIAVTLVIIALIGIGIIIGFVVFRKK